LVYQGFKPGHPGLVGRFGCVPRSRCTTSLSSGRPVRGSAAVSNTCSIHGVPRRPLRRRAPFSVYCTRVSGQGFTELVGEVRISLPKSCSGGRAPGWFAVRHKVRCVGVVLYFLDVCLSPLSFPTMAPRDARNSASSAEARVAAQSSTRCGRPRVPVLLRMTLCIVVVPAGSVPGGGSFRFLESSQTHAQRTPNSKFFSTRLAGGALDAIH